MNDFVDNNETKPNVCRGRSLRMSQLLRASLVNVSDSRPPEAVLNHFSHRHPLLRLHLRESEGIKCSFCNNIISDWAYACEKHCDHYLHEVCSNFPREIRHDFHPLLCLSPLRPIVLLAKMVSLIIPYSSHTIAVILAISIFMLNVVLYP
ncbi:hypothetical protein HAX54_025174 [Datura stramonium]|uniref:DC1 domain-containing protein n=1 Tax=Datura stramonium TaxID=4076 RepID=A0ABS8UYZ0_DATST|nr:hypothetical protein [Datura stramonium]